jgi:hypothetical protein
MTNINFPLTIRELKEMYKDRDWISLIFAYACLISFILCVLSLGLSFLGIPYASKKPYVLKNLSIIFFMISAISLPVVYLYRPKFLICKDKYLNKLYDAICFKIKKSLSQRDINLANIGLPYQIEIKDLYKWFPMTNKNDLEICWERLKKEKRIYWHGNYSRWFIKLDYQGKYL